MLLWCILALLYCLVHVCDKLVFKRNNFFQLEKEGELEENEKKNTFLWIRLLTIFHFGMFHMLCNEVLV